MTASASPRQSSFFAPREPRIGADEGPFDFGWSGLEEQRAPNAAKAGKLVMPNTELTAARPGKPKRTAKSAASSKANIPSSLRQAQAGLFDELDRASLRTPAQPEFTLAAEEPAPVEIPAAAETPPRNSSSYGLTITAFTAIALVAGGLGFVTAPQPELLTGSIAAAGQTGDAAVVEQVALLLPQAEAASLPVAAALGVGEGFLLKLLLTLLSLVVAVGAGFWFLRRLLSPKSSRLNFDGRDQRIDASLVPPNITAR